MKSQKQHTLNCVMLPLARINCFMKIKQMWFLYVERSDKFIFLMLLVYCSILLIPFLYLQCNLDYFTGSFDIGISLHACGVATDLVIQQCIKKQASFVCCPCCYGNIQDTHLLNYPLSKKFQDTILSKKVNIYNYL